ncbi:MAG: hypothetical protein ABSA49_14965 [Rhizomicrobium sp.]
MRGAPCKPASEDISTIPPRPRATMPGASVRTTIRGARTVTSTTRKRSSMGCAIVSPTGA